MSGLTFGLFVTLLKSRSLCFTQSIGSILFSFCALACLTPGSMASAPVDINWDNLSLSERQRNQLTDLDDRWKTVYSELAPRIRSNEFRLNQIINSPNPNPQEVLRIQKLIHDDKTRLKMEATQIFLTKRKHLTPNQDERLIKMINHTQTP